MKEDKLLTPAEAMEYATSAKCKIMDAFEDLKIAFYHPYHLPIRDQFEIMDTIETYVSQLREIFESNKNDFEYNKKVADLIENERELIIECFYEWEEEGQYLSAGIYRTGTDKLEIAEKIARSITAYNDLTYIMNGKGEIIKRIEREDTQEEMEQVSLADKDDA